MCGIRRLRNPLLVSRWGVGAGRCRENHPFPIDAALFRIPNTLALLPRWCLIFVLVNAAPSPSPFCPRLFPPHTLKGHPRSILRSYRQFFFSYFHRLPAVLNFPAVMSNERKLSTTDLTPSSRPEIYRLDSSFPFRSHARSSGFNKNSRTIVDIIS